MSNLANPSVLFLLWLACSVAVSAAIAALLHTSNRRNPQIRTLLYLASRAVERYRLPCAPKGQHVAICCLPDGPWALGQVLDGDGRILVLSVNRVLVPESPIALSWDALRLLAEVIYCVKDDRQGFLITVQVRYYLSDGLGNRLGSAA